MKDLKDKMADAIRLYDAVTHAGLEDDISEMCSFFNLHCSTAKIDGRQADFYKAKYMHEDKLFVIDTKPREENV
jgi:hypothetical protein